MKKYIIFYVCLILLISGCTSTKNSKKQNDVIQNSLPEQQLEEIKLKNISITSSNGVSTIITSVENLTDNDYMLKEYKMIIKDENGKVIVQIPGYVGNVIKAGEKRTIKSSVDIDLSNAKSVEYSVIK